MQQIFLPEFPDFESRSSDVTSFMWRLFERVQNTAVAEPVFSTFLLQQHNGHSSDQLPTDRQWLRERKSALRDVPSVKTQPFTPQGSSFVSPAKLSVAYWKTTCFVITHVSRNGLKFGSKSSCSQRWRLNMVICSAIYKTTFLTNNLYFSLLVLCF